MWHVLEHREMRRRARLRVAAEPGPLPRPDRPAGTDLLPQIRHIVVLMMENHSYDNYLGVLAGRGEGFPLGPDGQPEVSNTGTDGTVIGAFPQPATRQRPGVPSQSWQASHLQWGEGKCDGFVTSVQAVQSEAKEGTAAQADTTAEATGTAMGYWTEVTCRSTTGWRGRSRWLIGGSVHVWVPRFPTGAFSSPAPRTGLSTTLLTTCSTILRPGQSSTC